MPFQESLIYSFGQGSMLFILHILRIMEFLSGDVHASKKLHWAATFLRFSPYVTRRVLIYMTI